MWWWTSAVKVMAVSWEPQCLGLDRVQIAPLQAKARVWLERELALAAGGVDPDDVGEVGHAVRPGAAPAAVADSAHGSVDLVVDCRRVDVDDAVQDLRGQL